MSDQTKTCPICGTKNEAKVRFCRECGKSMVEGAAALASQTATPPKRGFQKGTLIAFLPPSQNQDPSPKPATPQPADPRPAASQPAAEAEPVEQRVSQASERSARKAQPAFTGKTMLGLPRQDLVPAAPGVKEEHESASPDRLDGTIRASSGTPPSAVAEPPATSATPPAASAARPAAGRRSVGGKTLLGIGSDTAFGPVALPPREEEAPKPAAAAPSPPAVPVEEAGATAAAAKRTMRGIPMPSGPAANAGPDRAAAPVKAAALAAAGQAVGVDSGRTMLGVGQAQQPSPPDRRAAGPAVSEHDRDEVRFPTRPGSGRKVAAVVAIFGLIAVGAGAALFLLGEAKRPAITASVVTVGSSDALRFEVPGAPPGSKLRFGGQERILQAGRAEFRLADDALRVGENVAPVDVVHPDGTVGSAKIPLWVPYLIRVDTSPLHTDEPAVDVIVNALPGSKVSLDGEPLELDEQGRGVRRYPIDAAKAPASGNIEQVVRYRIQPPSGKDAVDELHTSITVSTMQIDRPGLEAVTDKDSIEINGAVAPDSEVTLDGSPVPVKSGRFLFRYELPSLGEYTPRVIAREPGKAPHGRTIHIRRVADLKKEAESFQADKSLTYARIAQNPSIYQGQKVAFEGRVYNVSVQAGQSVIQMLVKDCPKGSRCSLWITYPADTDATNNSWVRVLGTVEGQQQFRSENERIVTVPKVAAAFVLLLSS